MRIEVTADGETTERHVTLNLDSLTLQQSVRLEDAIGSDRMAQIMDAGEFQPTPRLLQALIWAQLVGDIPGLAIDGFDLDLTELSEMFDDVVAPGGVVLDMNVDGATVEGGGVIAGNA